MYEAKRAHASHKLYSAERDGYSLERLELIADLRGAIGDGELVVHLQPKADLSTGAGVGVEALVRWAHPRRGLLPPAVPVRRRGHRADPPLTLSLLETACAADPRLARSRARPERGREPLDPQSVGPRSARSGPRAARAGRGRARAPRTRDHREHDHERPGPAKAVLDRLSDMASVWRSTTSERATRRFTGSPTSRSERSRSTSPSSSPWRSASATR